MRGALDWLARTIIVVLSMVATLSIIGSIAAIPSGRIEGRLGIDARTPRVETTIRNDQAPRVAADDERATAGTGQAAPAAAITPPPPRDSLEPWLESITYALIAIAALLAAGVFLLWRALRQWRRLAEAAERDS